MSIVKTPTTLALWDDMNELITIKGNGDIKFEHLNAYVRADNHLVQREVVPCFTFARLTVNDPRRMGKGSFKFMVECVQGFLEVVEHWPKVMYLENCLNERLAAHLLREGWTATPGGFGCDSYFKRVEYVPGGRPLILENV